VAGDRDIGEKNVVVLARIGRRLQSAGHGARIHFSAAC